MSQETRPWGSFEVLLKEPTIQVKRVKINPHSRLSLQKHEKRTEKWIVIAGQGLAISGSRETAVQKGSFFEVPCGEIHRMQNVGDEPLIFVEVQFGDYLGEDDIVRFQDDFGRV